VSSSSVVKEYLVIFICVFPLVLNKPYDLLPREVLRRHEDRRPTQQENTQIKYNSKQPTIQNNYRGTVATYDTRPENETTRG